jgi:ribonuclease Y
MTPPVTPPNSAATSSRKPNCAPKPRPRSLLATVVQRYAGEYTFESTTTSIAISSDEIKGRIIGREGRNIRAFEAATGVTVLIDDTPNAVVISGFDPVRRAVAREAMARLIADGRIHPTRIEEVVGAVQQEMDETILRLGEEAVSKTWSRPPARRNLPLLGRLRFRHSFSQNILDHSIEVAHLAGLIAAELGLGGDIEAAKRAGLLHDIGKAVTHEMEGPHAIVGAEMVRRHGEDPRIVNAIASHHQEVEPEGPLGIIVSAADAISASRPGARSETMSTYLKRVESLERLGSSFPGVEKCFAVQAGRELRVMVRSEQLTDAESFHLARAICRKIEDELQYPRTDPRHAGARSALRRIRQVETGAAKSTLRIRSRSARRRPPGEVSSARHRHSPPPPVTRPGREPDWFVLLPRTPEARGCLKQTRAPRPRHSPIGLPYAPGP